MNISYFFVHEPLFLSQYPHENDQETKGKIGGVETMHTIGRLTVKYSRIPV